MNGSGGDHETECILKVWYPGEVGWGCRQPILWLPILNSFTPASHPNRTLDLVAARIAAPSAFVNRIIFGSNRESAVLALIK